MTSAPTGRGSVHHGQGRPCIGFAAALAAALTVSGCTDGGSSGEAAPPAPSSSASSTASSAGATSSPTATGTPSSPPAARSTGYFVAVLHATAADLTRGRTDAQLAAVAVRVCGDLAAGRSAADVVATVRAMGTTNPAAIDAASAGLLVQTAIDSVCADQSARMGEF